MQKQGQSKLATGDGSNVIADQQRPDIPTPNGPVKGVTKWYEIQLNVPSWYNEPRNNKLYLLDTIISK